MPKKVKEMKNACCCKPKAKACDAVYGLGMIGSLVYFIQHAANFGEGLIGVLKSIVWPAFVVYRVLEMLKF